MSNVIADNSSIEESINSDLIDIRDIISPFSLDDIFQSKLIKNTTNRYNINTIPMIENDNIAGNGFNSRTRSDNSSSYNEIIEPEYDLCGLAKFKYFSDSLNACIKAYGINICGFGNEYLEEKETFKKNGKTYYRESREEVSEDIVKEMEKEFSRITMFFKSVSLDIPWLLIQKLKTESKFTTGNAYLEIERSFDGSLQGLALVESDKMRLTKRSPEIIKVKQKVKNPITLEFEEQIRGRRFRKFVQDQANDYQNNGSYIWFKEFGDPRIMNSCTGEYIRDINGFYITKLHPSFIEKLRQNGQSFKLATEILHFKVYNTEDIDGYGIPPWVSLIPTLLGVKFSDLSDYNTLENKGLPEMMMIIEGAKSKDVLKSLVDNIEENRKLQKYKNILIVSADANNSGTNTQPNYKNPSIRLEPLNQLLKKVGLKGKTEYVEKINERVAGVFRLPTFFVGKLNNINRSVAEVAKDMANEQVFLPESMDEDDIINMLIMPELDAKYYKYHSKTSKMENPELKKDTIKEGVLNGSILPSEARREYSEMLDGNFSDIDSEFMNTPYPVSIRASRPSVNNVLSALNNNPEKITEKEETININKKKLLHLEKTNDSEIYESLKKRIEKSYGLNINDMYIYAE